MKKKTKARMMKKRGIETDGTNIFQRPTACNIKDNLKKKVNVKAEYFKKPVKLVHCRNG